ncbi:MAG TPA: chromate transporter [Clostridiaceae bacterium]|nr:chromate transporter [Clostridiaceae bacterium]
MILWELFWSFLQIGLFSFGGGYASLPLIEEQVVNNHQWLTMEAFTDLVTISQMTPGPIAINSASFVGIQIAGIKGALVATIATLIPGTIIVLIVATLYKKYSNLPLMQRILLALRPAVIALIASAAVSLVGDAIVTNTGKSSYYGINFFSIAIFVISLFAYHKIKKADPILVMLVMGCLGGLGFYLLKL